MTSNNLFKLSPWVEMVFQTGGRESNFFGYYYSSPVNANGTRLLAHRVSFDGRNIHSGDTAEIGYWDLRIGSFVSLGNTTAFNWQQGAMLQWLPPDFNSRIVYNDHEANRYVGRIVDLNRSERYSLEYPVYALHPSGDFALGVNFERLHFCRPGYNYPGASIDPKWDCPLHPDDGIFKIDLATGRFQLLLSTEKVVRDHPLAGEEDAYHTLDHIIWNPSGSRFAFLHRTLRADAEITKSRLLTAAADGSNLYQFPDCDIYSHLGWRSEHEFWIYARRSSRLRQGYAGLVDKQRAWFKPVAGAYRWLKNHLLSQKNSMKLRGAFYMRVRDGSPDMEPMAMVQLVEDGHPSWTRNGRFMLTDTYADNQGYRHLLLFDYKRNHLYRLGQFFSPYNACGYRCDLHPRFSPNEEDVIIDTAHTGRRQMMILRLNWKMST